VSKTVKFSKRLTFLCPRSPPSPAVFVSPPVGCAADGGAAWRIRQRAGVRRWPERSASPDERKEAQSSACLSLKTTSREPEKAMQYYEIETEGPYHLCERVWGATERSLGGGGATEHEVGGVRNSPPTILS